MTPKEKALELFDKFNNPDTTRYPYVHNAQQCTLIAIEEIIKANPYEINKTDMDSTIDYWQEVKQEIEKL